MISRPSRVLAHALILSLSLHAVLLIGVVRILPTRIDGSPLAIQLVARPRAGTVENGERRMLADADNTERTQVVERGELPITKRASAVPPKPKAGKAATTLPGAEPKTPAAKTVLSASAEVARNERAVGATAGASGAAPLTTKESVSPGGADDTAGALSGSALSASSAGAPAQRDGVSAGDLRQYRLALGVSARRFKRYPPLARERGWEGTVEIALDFSPLAAEPSVSVATSCGKTILDEQTLETLRQAVRQTELPKGLRGRNFRLLQEIVFSLDEG